MSSEVIQSDSNKAFETIEPKAFSPFAEVESERFRIEAKMRASEHWSMPWQEFEVSLGLRNALALRNLNIETPQRAEEYLRNCGFDLSSVSHRRMFEQAYGEALFIIRHTLLTATERQRFRVPPELLLVDDPRRILLIASNRSPRKRYKRLWACALLKVMYAVVNLEYSGKLKDLEYARDKIFDRVRALTKTDDTGKCWLEFKNRRVPLEALDWKDAKTRTSIVMKLLHKPDSIVDEVFDFLGVRFVVAEEADIPHLLRLLTESDIIIPHQVLGIRTRNTLLNLKKSRRLLNLILDLFSTDTVSFSEFEKMCEKIPWLLDSGEAASKSKSPNAFTSSHYRALQLTVRHLVRTPNPAFVVVESLTRELRHYRGLDGDDPSLLSLVPPEISRYFPVEIQMMDAASYDLSKFGPASHEQYKALQLTSVRERVLGGLLYMSDEKMAAQEINV